MVASPIATRCRSCCHAGRDADRDRQHVIDHERCGGDQARPDAEVGLGDGVGAAAGRVFVDDLLIRQREDRQQEHDGDADRNGIAQRGGPDQDQDQQDFLRRVGDGGKGVR